MTIDRKRRRPLSEIASLIAIDTVHPARTILFDINYQLQKILGPNSHTLAFQCAVNGVVYGVTVTREEKRLTCHLLAFIDDQKSQIFWPSVEHILEGPYATSNLRADFDFTGFSSEIAVLFDTPMPVVRRRLVSVFGPDNDDPADLESRLKQAKELAAELAGEAEPLHVSLGASFPEPSNPSDTKTLKSQVVARRKSAIFIPTVESQSSAVASVRAKIHSVFLQAKGPRKTVMLDPIAIKVTEELLKMRDYLAMRNPREPLRKSYPPPNGFEHVLYVTHTSEGLWVDAGLVGLQRRNRIFIPFQLDGSYVKIPPEAPWQLIADMLGV